MCRCHKHDVGGMSGVPIHVYQRSSPSRRFSAFRLGNMHIATRRSGIMHCYPPHNQSGKYYLNRVCFAHRTHYFLLLCQRNLVCSSSRSPLISSAALSPNGVVTFIMKTLFNFITRCNSCTFCPEAAGRRACVSLSGLSRCRRSPFDN